MTDQGLVDTGCNLITDTNFSQSSVINPLDIAKNESITQQLNCKYIYIYIYISIISVSNQQGHFFKSKSSDVSEN